MWKDEVINDVQTIVIDKSTYIEESKFWSTVATQLDILTSNGYECKFYYEDCGVYVIEFAPQNHEYGGSSCVWITSDEHEDIEYFRESKKEEEKEFDSSEEDVEELGDDVVEDENITISGELGNDI